MKLSHGLGVSIAAAVSMLQAGRAGAVQGGAPIGPAEPPLIDPGRVNAIPGTPDMAPEVPLPESPVWKPRTGYGVALTAGGGLGDYVAAGIRNDTGAVGTWNLRASYGTRTYVGVEGAYVGGAGSIVGFGLGGNSLLVRNGLEATLRLNAPLMVKRTLLEPYLFGGFGWDHYTVTHSTPTASIDGFDDTLTTPFGAGFDVTYLGVIADARFAYRPTFDENITNMPANDDLTNWTLTAQLGYEF